MEKLNPGSHYFRNNKKIIGDSVSIFTPSPKHPGLLFEERNKREGSSCVGSEHQPQAQYAGLSAASDGHGDHTWAEDRTRYCDLILLRTWVPGNLLRMEAGVLADGMFIEPQGLPELPCH